MISSLVLWTCCLTSLAPADAPQRVVLQNGVVLEGPTSVGPDGALVVDLGFDVLTVPRESVVSIETVASTSPPPTVELELEDIGAAPALEIEEAPAGGPARLWRTEAAPDVLALDDAVKAVGEAVVLVRTPVSLGSGFVIHPEGYLVTNDHVVEGSNELTVIVFRQATDGLEKAEYKKVRIVATAELLDLALLKLETDDDERFVSVPLGDSHVLQQGEDVFAVGNPMGMERSLSEGIIGLRSRLLGGQSYVQTTAALSPGNSGGPLFDRRGEVIGVNSLKIVAQGAEGLSFSIPVNRVKAFLDDQEAYAFDPLNPNTGHRYYAPPKQPGDSPESKEEGR